MPIVKSIGNNSLTANLPDNAGELRGREARTAPIERHNSPALSGFFVRRAQKGRCVVESVETKDKLDETRELTRGLAAAAVDAARDLKKTKIVIGACINFLLEASPDLLGDDIIEELECTQKGIRKDLSEGGESTEAAESEADTAIEEAVGEPEMTKDADILWTAEQIEKILDKYTPDFQLKIMQLLADRQPQRFAKDMAEMERDEARDNLIATLYDLPMDVQTKLYRMFHVTVVDEGKEIAA